MRCSRVPRPGWSMALALWMAGVAGAAGASDLLWSQDDWSGGRYESAIGVDPEVAPGRLVLQQRLDDIRYLAAPVDFQGLYSMEVLRDTLYITSSDYPYIYDGAKVLAYDVRTGAFAVVYEPYETGLHIVKRWGETLYIPGPDAMDPWGDPGSIYLYEDHEWIEKATIPNALHVNDVELCNGILYTTAGHWGGPGGVWISHDHGETFEQVLNLPRTGAHLSRRFFGLGSIGDRVFAQPDGFEPEVNQVYSTTNGTDWDTIPVPNMPVDKQATFTAWGDSLLMTIHNRMYIWNGTQWIARWLPYEGYRWCRGIHKYKGLLYGGGLSCEIYRWLHDSEWEWIGALGLTPESEEIEAMATYYGRLYVSTSRTEETQQGRLYVSAAEPHGTLLSPVHDFGAAAAHCVFAWEGFLTSAEDLVRFRLRSGATREQLLQSAFVGPDGSPGSYYRDPETPGPALHDGHRFFQYEAELFSPEGLHMPVLERVTLSADSADIASAGDLPISGGSVRLSLSAPQPNPTRGSLWLEAWAQEGARVRLELRVLDPTGRIVRRVERVASPEGRARWLWDLRDERGRRVPAGLYRIQAVAGDAAGAARSVVVLQ